MSEITLKGGRYVYFKSVKEPMYSSGLGMLSSINSMLQPKSQDDTSMDQHLDNINKYIKFIQEMANSARDNELAFLKQQLSLLKEKDTNNPKIVQWLEKLQAGQLNSNSYQEIYTIFNSILKNNSYSEIELEQQIQNMKTTKTVFNKLPENIRKLLTQQYDENMKFYRGTFFSKGYQTDPATIKEYCTTLSDTLAKKINSILKTFSRNNEFKQTLINALDESRVLNISDDTFKTIVINFIVDTVLTEGLDETNSIEKLSTKIAWNLKLNLKDMAERYATEQYANSILTSNMSLEEMALTSKDSIGNYLTKLDINSLREIKRIYADGDLNLTNEIDNLIALISDTKSNQQPSRSLINKLTRHLKHNIKERAKGLVPDAKIDQMTRSSFRSQFGHISNFITPTTLRETLVNGLSGLSISHDAVAELLGMKEFQNQIAGVVTSHSGGQIIKQKADFNISTGACPSDLSDAFDQEKMASIINNTLQEQYENFFIKYQELSSGQTDIELAMQAYQEWIDEMQEQIDKMIDLDTSIKNKVEAKKQVYEEMYNTFSIGVSVKDYNLYNNTLGLHGGSLGSYTAPEQVMKNIYKMYELGGITAIDVNMLMTAVINCGDAMIGSFIRPTLETYLLGGAALIMFDDSFALSDKFLQRMTSELKGQRVVNIYRLNTRYVPASMVLTKIGNNLNQIYSDIAQNVKLTNVNSHVNIINNVNETILQTSAIKDLEPQKQWEAVRDYTEGHIKIQFSFMSGLLDVLDEIPAAFDVQ